MSDYTRRAPVFTDVEAADYARLLRNKGKKIVFTNGCFDLLHPGHLEILQKAREMGDCLFVGVNSDDSVAGLKGPSRPLQPLETRTAILSSLRCVDCVIPFSQETPLELIRKIIPDVLVKGGDYTADEIVGAEIIAENGGRVVIVPLLSGYSTTALAEKMN